MKPISRLFTVAAAAAAALLTSCAAHHTPLTATIIGAPTATHQDSNTAPVTFSHQSRSATAAPPTDKPTSQPGAANPRTTQSSTTTSSTVTLTYPAASDGEPAQRVITNPGYSPDAINRKAPEQVAWAYITLRMSYSNQDSGPTEHTKKAATFAVPMHPNPNAAPATAGVSPAPTDLTSWDQVIKDKMQASVAVTEMDVYPPVPIHAATNTQALVHVTWTGTLSSELNAPVRSSGATTVTLQRQRDGNWLVSDSGFSAPN